jgi:hypothetical protein
MRWFDGPHVLAKYAQTAIRGCPSLGAKKENSLTLSSHPAIDIAEAGYEDS